MHKNDTKLSHLQSQKRPKICHFKNLLLGHDEFLIYNAHYVHLHLKHHLHQKRVGLMKLVDPFLVIDGTSLKN